ILILPDSGYVFAGWSHDEYVSLRGETIKADSGMMHYEEIVIYGDVELRANFVPEVEKPYEKEILPDKTVNTDKVWSYKKDLYVRTKNPGSIVRVYSPEGLLLIRRTIITEGTTEITTLPNGIYIVTINNGTGWKVMIIDN
ncbi:MAG: T9SS type A sorting domain-containing protein, partial [Tannerella sp.]|nr:T9SS type A sorting domain-containing protein [Tannerella sp.]